MANNAPAGWYGQPDGSQRYWDGAAWTEHISPAAALPGDSTASADATPPVDAAESTSTPDAGDGTSGTPTAPVPGVPAVPAEAAAIGESTRPWWKKKRFVIPGAIVLLLILISALGGSSDESDAVIAPSPSPSATESSPSPSPTPSPTETVAATTFIMPDLLGKDLQSAQDELQALGSFVLDQEDASGEGRVQVLDSNWQVCTQSVKAGDDAPIDEIVLLAAVKDDEHCPGDEPAETAEAVAEEPAEVEASDDSGLNASQEQAARLGLQYLEYTSFSRTGLIGQLVYEEFSESDAKAAVDSLTVDWTEQADKKAQEYLDYSAFSRGGLIDQLEYEGFTTKQAEHGATAVGL